MGIKKIHRTSLNSGSASPLLFLRERVAQILALKRSPISIVDFGCASTELFEVIFQSIPFLDGNHMYIAVDCPAAREAFETARQVGALDTDLRSEFVSSGTLFRRSAHDFVKPIKLVILRNAVSRIPMADLPSTLFHLTRLAGQGARIVIVESVNGFKARPEAITWELEDFRRFFPNTLFAIDYYKDKDRRHVAWFAVEVSVKSSAVERVGDWERRCISAARNKLEQAKREVESLKQRPLSEPDLCRFIDSVALKSTLELQLTCIVPGPTAMRSETDGTKMGEMQYPVVTLASNEITGLGSRALCCQDHAVAYKLPAQLEINSKKRLVPTRRSQPRDAPSLGQKHYGLQDYSIELEPATRQRRLLLRLKPITYRDHILSNLSINECSLNIRGNSLSPRDNFRLAPNQFQHSPLANLLALSVAIVTAKDNCIVFGLRSRNSLSLPAGYVTPVFVGLRRIWNTRMVDSVEDCPLDPAVAFVEEAKEMLGLTVDPVDVVFPALIQELSYLQPVLIGVATVNCSAEELLQRAAGNSRERFQQTCLYWLPFEIEPVSSHLIAHHDSWVPSCAITMIYALINTFGHSNVVSALEGGCNSGCTREKGPGYMPPSRRYIRSFLMKTLSRAQIDGPILDVGCGYRSNRMDLLRLNNRWTVKTLDLFEGSGADFCLDAQAMQVIPSDSYGCVICTELLEHVIEPRRVLAEIKRILKPGGLIIVTVPFDVEIHENQGQPDYWRMTPDGLRIMLGEYFIDERIEYTGDRLSPLNVLARANKAPEGNRST